MTDRNKNSPGFKHTKVGWIPNDWECVPLVQVCKNTGQYGANASSIEYSKELPRFIRITDILEDGRLSDENIRSINTLDIKAYLLNENDFLFARTGATVGKTYLHKNNKANCAYAGYLIRFKPDLTRLDANFLKNYTATRRYWNWVHNITRAGAQPNINAKEYSSMPIPLPAIKEQELIVQILSKWDDAIEKFYRLIIFKGKLKKGLAQQLLTGQKFKEFKKQEWKPTKLKNFLVPTVRAKTKPDESFLSLGIRSHCKGIFHKYDFEPEDIALDELYEVKENDLILNITFAWEGAIAIATSNDDGALVSHRFPTYTFKLDKMLPAYMKHVIKQKRFIFDLGVVSPGGAGRNRVLNKNDFLNMQIKIPSVEEQQKIASVLNVADEEIRQLKEKLELLKQQKKGLMQKLLTGEVRLKI